MDSWRSGDVNDDGEVDKLDSLMISRIYYGHLKTSGKLIINSGNYKETLCFVDDAGNIIAYMGLSGIATNSISANQLSADQLMLNGEDLYSKIIELENRIKELENRLIETESEI